MLNLKILSITINMLKEERQDYILKQLSLHHRVLSTDLCQQLNVSLDTIRRDLHELAKNGSIHKVHGGAISKGNYFPFQQPQVYAQAEKKAIASKALTLIKDGMMILTGGGTVMLELARMIPADLKGIIFTVSPLVALEIAERSSVDVILIGGKLARNSYICTGASVVSQLADIQVDLCFLGTNGVSIAGGVTDHDWEVVQVKKAMVRSAHKTALLCIAEKLNTTQKMKVCNLSTLSYLMTDLQPEDDKLADYAKTVKTV